MKNKTVKVEGNETCREVLLQVRRAEDDDFIEISAWHNTENGYLLQKSKIYFEEI